MNWKGARWDLYSVFSDKNTDGLLNNIIFYKSVRDSVGEFTLNFSFCTKIFN
jgi:hypothetical protein